MTMNVSEQRISEAIQRQDLCGFIVRVAQALIPSSNYLHNWHMDAIVHALLCVHHGIDQRLIITQPPRTLKSICTSVAFPAWSIGLDPSKKFVCISYSDVLAGNLARYFRLVITSDWYRVLFRT